ncbi:hypothetical protein LY76DRAFT_594858 [Colletotrichum caudatum]|nr:hypothetical protein LY76DRAFT_594858 [Colletotrichum caudatum]
MSSPSFDSSRPFGVHESMKPANSISFSTHGQWSTSCAPYSEKFRSPSTQQAHTQRLNVPQQTFINPPKVSETQEHTRSTQMRSTCISCPRWHNWLARQTVNLEVGGSSPPRGDSVVKSHHEG